MKFELSNDEKCSVVLKEAIRLIDACIEKNDLNKWEEASLMLALINYLSRYFTKVVSILSSKKKALFVLKEYLGKIIEITENGEE